MLIAVIAVIPRLPAAAEGRVSEFHTPSSRREDVSVARAILHWAHLPKGGSVDAGAKTSYTKIRGLVSGGFVAVVDCCYQPRLMEIRNAHILPSGGGQFIRYYFYPHALPSGGPE